MKTVIQILVETCYIYSEQSISFYEPNYIDRINVDKSTTMRFHIHVSLT